MIRSAHVCIAANTSWYVYNFRANLIRELRHKGYRVTVYSPSDDYVSRIRDLGAVHVPLIIDNGGTNPFSETVSLFRIGTVLRALRPDVILTYTPKVNIYVSFVARVIGVTVIANVSGLGQAFASGWLRTIAKTLYRIALTTPHMVFFQNDEDRKEFVNARLVDPERTERLPGSGVDVNRFLPSDTSSPSKAFSFLLPARMLWDKGVAEFVEAAHIVAALHRGVRFLLLGFMDVRNPRAIPRSVMDAWVKEGIVEYLGAVDDVRPTYANVNCIVLPSYYREGVPRALLEAASMGIPVITTNTPGCRDAVDDAITGFLCRSRDARDLALKMQAMLSLGQAERFRMG